MVNIYNYLKNVWQKGKREVLNNSFLYLISLVLITIPLHYRFSNIAIILLAGYSVLKFKPKRFNFQKEIIVLIALYLLMCLSLLWSIDFKTSVQALSKELAFLIIPVCFLINPALSREDKNKIIQYFSYSFLGYTLFYLSRAIVRYYLTNDVNVFFYHELVTFDVNAIHISVYISIAFFYFFLKQSKTNLDKLALLLLLFFLVLLSSKNIIIIFIFLLLLSVIRVLKIKWSPTKLMILGVSIIVFGFGFYGKLKDRFLIEIVSNKIGNNHDSTIDGPKGMVYNVSIMDAWNKDKFQGDDYFPGTALRVYQARIFKEMLQEDAVFYKGYGLNAVQKKIIEKRKEHNLYSGYDNFNFHNQYIQFFAELGVVGLLLLLLILAINLKNAIKNKDFIHFSFAILMISLFLTESFLSRQRGIVFFVMMYCLFNTKIKELNSKN